MNSDDPESEINLVPVADTVNGIATRAELEALRDANPHLSYRDVRDLLFEYGAHHGTVAELLAGRASRPRSTA